MANQTFSFSNTASGVLRGYVPPQSTQRTGRQQGYPLPGQTTGPQQGYPLPGQKTGPQQGYPLPGQKTGPQQGYPLPGQKTGPQQGYPLPGQTTGPQRAQAAAAQQAGRQQSSPLPEKKTRTGSARRRNTAASASAQGSGAQEWSATGQRGYTAPVATRAPAPQQPKKKNSAVRGMLTVLAILILIAGLAVGGTYGYRAYAKNKLINDTTQPYDNLFVPGVYVDGISLGGMTPEQGMNSVQSQILERNDAWRVTLTYKGETMAEINAQMLNMSVDIGAVMNNAWIQGHEGDREARYEAMLRLQESPYHGYTAVPSGNNAVIDRLLNQIKEKIDTPATDAVMTTFDTNLDYPFVFVEEQYGTRLDTAPVIEKLYHMVSEMESGSVELEPEIVVPNVTRNDLQKHYMLRSTATTPISTSSTEERNNNIRRAFEFIDGTILEPGVSFSFNDIVGQRTEANGFFPAIEYAYGEHVEGIGGGVCQASTTVYQAAVCAGLQIKKREPHSDAVNYTEYGKDATVYWVGKRKIDLVFLNNTEEPIYIVAAVQRDPSNKRRLIAKVSMYGADLGETRYELATEVLAELEPPENPQYVKDSEGTYVYYTDQQKSVSKAKPGYLVRSYRLEYTGTEVTDRKILYTDTYDARAERIYVGTHSRD